MSTPKPRAYRASFKGAGVTRDTPRAAALAFFEAHPKGRKCTVVEGTTDGPFFTVVYGLRATGEWPQSWSEVTRKTAAELPDTARPVSAVESEVLGVAK